jgi:hypothetical protein
MKTVALLTSKQIAAIETGNIRGGAALFLCGGCGKNEFHRIGTSSMSEV